MRSGSCADGDLNSAARRSASMRSVDRYRKESMPEYASMRRTPEPIDDSPSTATGPIWEVWSTWVPPHSSMENGPPISTTRTRSP